MSETGAFEEDMVRAMLADQFPEEILNMAIENCKNEGKYFQCIFNGSTCLLITDHTIKYIIMHFSVGKDDCETAGKVTMCFVRNNLALEF